jgi:hypothetical protein
LHTLLSQPQKNQSPNIKIYAFSYTAKEHISFIFDYKESKTKVIFGFISLYCLKGEAIRSTMMQFFVLTIVALSNLVNVSSEISFAEIDKCTTIIVGKTAGSEGPMTTHTADCSDCDFRLAKVNIKLIHHFVN